MYKLKLFRKLRNRFDFFRDNGELAWTKPVLYGCKQFPYKMKKITAGGRCYLND